MVRLTGVGAMAIGANLVAGNGDTPVFPDGPMGLATYRCAEPELLSFDE